MVYTEYGIRAGNSNFNIFKIHEDPNSFYFIFGFPEIGLHFSFHKPTSQLPKFHAHIKSEKIGIHDDLDLPDELFSSECWNHKIQKFIDRSADWLNPDLGDEPVLLIPSLTEALSFSGKQRRHLVDLGYAFKGPFITTEANRINDLFDKLPSIYPLGSIRDTLIAIKDPNNIIAVDRDGTSFEFNFLEIRELFRFERFEKSIIKAVGTAIMVIEKKRPNVFHKWIPKSFSLGLKDTFDQLNPQIVKF